MRTNFSNEVPEFGVDLDKLAEPSTEGEFMSGSEVETIKTLIGDWNPVATTTTRVAAVHALAKRLGVELPG